MTIFTELKKEIVFRNESWFSFQLPKGYKPIETEKETNGKQTERKKANA